MTLAVEVAGAPLSERTTLRLGGPARRLVVATTEAEVVETIRAADASGEPALVLGSGSNVVVADSGFDGVVVQVDTRGIDLSPAVGSGCPVAVTVQAGEDWDSFVARAVAEGLTGVEALAGIPGRVGATPIQNVGAYGQDVSQTIVEVRVHDRRSGTIRGMTPGECAFTYRHSVFKGDDRYVVLAVTFALQRSDKGTVVRYAELARALRVPLGERAPSPAIRDAVLELRRAKGMVLDGDDHDTWSVGSFFTNPVLAAAEADRLLPAAAPRWPEGDDRTKVSAAWLIEQSGFAKGYGNGRVRLSAKHTLALTNRGSAQTADLLALAREIRAGVRERFGITLAPEPVFVGCSL